MMAAGTGAVNTFRLASAEKIGRFFQKTPDVFQIFLKNFMVK